jgi:hypothetical protein
MMTMNWAAAMSPRASHRLLLGLLGVAEREVDDMVSPS